MSQKSKIFAYFAKSIEDEIGMIFNEDNFYQLENRLDYICSTFKYTDLNALYLAAQKGLPQDVRLAFIDAATNNETSFFRDKKMFELLDSTVFPDLYSQKHPLNMWSVASSSGQEAYSLGILFEEWLIKQKTTCNYSIEGTDICTEALNKANLGKYSQFEVQRGLSNQLRTKYFEEQNGQKLPWQVKDSLKKNISFRSLNLAKTFDIKTKYDIVLCRNVLIYQNLDRKNAILKNVVSCLRPGGYLVMGSGETAHGMADSFETILKDGALVFCKKSDSTISKAA